MNADAGTTMHIASMVTIIGYKIVLAIIGYLIVKLGYKLLVKGITGGFKFQGRFMGINAGLVSASPGLLFLFLGVILLIFTVMDDDKIKTSITGAEPVKITKPYLPAKPPTLGG